MTATPAITIRRTRRDDVPAIIAMLADDHLGRARTPASTRNASMSGSDLPAAMSA